jgi:serine O-acetyltransferase
MIKTSEELKFFLAADKFAMGKKNSPKITDYVWRFLIILRKLEYYTNKRKTFFDWIFYFYYKIRKNRMGVMLGLDIPINVLGPGVRINHFGNIVINKKTKIGMWCDIHQGVNIGTNTDKLGNLRVPKIGNNVWIGPGAKLFGDIDIKDNVAIGANAVVNKSFQSSVTIGGIPAKIIKNTGTEAMNVAASNVRMNMFFEQHSNFKKYRTNG